MPYYSCPTPSAALATLRQVVKQSYLIASCKTAGNWRASITLSVSLTPPPLIALLLAPPFLQFHLFVYSEFRSKYLFLWDSNVVSIEGAAIVSHPRAWWVLSLDSPEYMSSRRKGFSFHKNAEAITEKSTNAPFARTLCEFRSGSCWNFT